MRFTKISSSACILAVMLIFSSESQAALIDNGNGLVYDSAQNITWLTDWNLAQSSGFDADGQMNWATANTWSAGLTVGGTSGWTLASLDQFNSLFGSVGNLSNASLPFINVMTSGQDQYWSSTEFTGFPGYTKTFYASTGGWNPVDQTRISDVFAVAVHSGNITASAVPEPESYAMFLAGLGAIGFMSRRRAH